MGDAPKASAADAIMLRAHARRKRAVAATMREDWGDPTGARFETMEADAMDARAAAALDPLSHTTGRLTPGNGGEMIAGTKDVRNKSPFILDTVRERPDMLAADASLDRLRLAADADVLVLAVDTAESIGAGNALERMLAHQMAAAHRMAMTMAAAADEELRAYANSGHRLPHRSIEAARMAATSARLMDTFGRALLTLDRLRNGGRQTVVVQHVNVADGGQAVVAGAVGAKREGPGGHGT